MPAIGRAYDPARRRGGALTGRRSRCTAPRLRGRDDRRGTWAAAPLVRRAQPDLSALVRELAQAHHDANADYEVPLAELRDAAGDLGVDLAAIVAAGVLARGGSDADAAHAVALIDGFQFGDTAVSPTLFIPFMDAHEFDQGDWDGHTPAAFSTELSREGDTMHVVAADGTEELLGEDALGARATWFIGMHIGDQGPSTERLWARCWCVQTNPDPWTVGCACMTHGSPTGHGRCGRTGLFNNTCSGADVCGC